MEPRRPVNRVSPRLRPSGRAATPSAPTGAGSPNEPAGRRPGRSGAGRSKSVPARRDRPDAAARAYARDRAGHVRPVRGTRSWLLPTGLGLAAAILTAFAVVAAFRPGVGDGNAAFVDTKATEQVRAAAGDALKTVYSYDAKAIAGDKGAAAYKDAVHKVVTGKMLADFDKFADTTVSAIQQAQSTATAVADPIGVTLLTGDRAELLIELTVSAARNGVPQESAAGPIVLHMQKINGRWLAAEITDR
ncbi:hypothetical protein [Nocardia aurantia]|uniref:Mce-associated membrane protein n=1 Tax=Nocardia aurantia TaxID=2585199 RepID=A0A7K0DX38_9NOCA|nr:hypothetical protein [Nocardia aurantia]MQY30285.1 hypothetical protein [Nocardia aurantia]